jgi:hypothetical protein
VEIMKELSPKVYKERLLELAKFLRKLPKKRFDYTTWVGENWEGKKDLSCGTTACALGWATAIPSLRKAGLRMVKIYDSYVNAVVCMKNEENPNHNSPEAAAAEVFGLDTEEFEYLFVPESSVPSSLYDMGLDPYGPDEDADAKEVARHIRRFAKAKYGKQ